MSKIDDLRVKYASLKPDTFNRLVDGDETPTKKYSEFLLKTWNISPWIWKFTKQKKQIIKIL